MVKQKFGSHLLFILAIAGVVLLSLLLLGIGIFVAAPWVYTTIYSAWKDQAGFNEEKSILDEEIIL